MSLSHGIVNNICIVEVQGDFTWDMKHSLGEYLKNLVSIPEVRGILLNMEGVQFIDSQLIGIIVSTYKTFQKHQIPLALCHVVASGREVFRLAKLDTIIKIFQTEEEALNAMM